MSNATREQHIVLNSIHIKQLKGLKNCEITFDGPLTAIMGVNGIGKSTIIHALSCCFRKADDYGEERRFSSFFPPSTNATWKNSSFTLNYDIVDESGRKIREGSTNYEKAFDRWAPKYDRQEKKNIRFLGIDTCMPDIERYKEERFHFKTTERTDKNAQKIIEGASLVLNKDHAYMVGGSDTVDWYFAKDGSMSEISAIDADQKASKVSIAGSEYSWKSDDGKILIQTNGTTVLTLIPAE